MSFAGAIDVDIIEISLTSTSAQLFVTNREKSKDTRGAEPNKSAKPHRNDGMTAVSASGMVFHDVSCFYISS